ncbi:MAG: hypothetical protein KDC53_14730, partial [Saprospiraceae bacterium]|nr:hypothetical protein [Saprospiraceae bacterium]
MKIWSVILFLLFLVQILKGQPSSETVEEVLLDLEEQYQVRFSYSKNIVPYDATVALTYDRKSLVEVLEQLGSQTGIIYRRRGSRVVLNFDPQRKASVENGHVVLVNEASTDTLSYSDGNTNNIPPEQKVADDVNVQPRDTLGRIAQLDNNKEHKEIAYQQNYYEAESLTFDVQDDVQFAQVSLIPFKSLLGRKGGKINHLSFNLLAGYTGGVQGLELGGYGNVVKGDVLGIQLSGFGNYVGGNVEGIQLAGFANFNQGIVRGFQLGGMANVNVQADAVQIAGAFNLNRRISRGYQLAGFFNAGRNITGGQLSAFFNWSLGNVYFQGS